MRGDSFKTNDYPMNYGLGSPKPVYTGGFAGNPVPYQQALKAWKTAQGPVPAAAPTAPAYTPNLNLSTVPAAMLGQAVPGLADYFMALPSYQYYGAPGVTRPPTQSALLAAMGGQMPGQPAMGATRGTGRGGPDYEALFGKRFGAMR